MRISTLIAWLVGVALLAALVALNGSTGPLDAVAQLRWWFAIVVAYHLVPIVLDARAWSLLFADRPRFPPLVLAIWISEGLNGVFPVPHVGELMRARLAARFADKGEGVATVVVDLTLSVATEGAFALVGLALFATLPHSLGTVTILAPIAALIAGGALMFYFLQRAGLFALAGRIVHRWSETARRLFDIGSAKALDDDIRRIYGRRKPLLKAGAWRFAGWLAGAGETWLIFQAMGHPIGVGEAIMIESLGHAARTAAFFIPGGLGVQDVVLTLLGSALGYGPEAGLVLALAKRCRELILGVPALIACYFLEARRLLRQWADARA